MVHDFTHITFTQLLRVDENFKTVELLEFRKGSGLHSSWLTKAARDEYGRGLPKDKFFSENGFVFTEISADKFVFRKEDLAKVIIFLSKLYNLSEEE